MLLQPIKEIEGLFWHHICYCKNKSIYLLCRIRRISKLLVHLYCLTTLFRTVISVMSGFFKLPEYSKSTCKRCSRKSFPVQPHSTKKPVTTMLTYPWKCTVLHCNHLGNTWKPLVLMTRHFDYCPSASEGDNQSVRSSAPVVSRCFPGGYNVKLYISRGRLAWWLLAFLHSAC